MMNQKKLNALGEFGEKSFLVGIEKEALRTDYKGFLSKRKTSRMPRFNLN